MQHVCTTLGFCRQNVEDTTNCIVGDVCSDFFLLVLMEGQAEYHMCTDMGARTTLAPAEMSLAINNICGQLTIDI